MEPLDSKRSDFIDFAKGIGIIMVVWGHSMIVKSAFLYSFHLPMFFLISGFLYKKTPFSVIFQNKINRILIPYFFFFLISWFLFLILILLGIDSAPLNLHLNNLPYVIIGIEKNGGNGPIWFLACLFSLTLIYSLIDNYIHNIYLLNTCILLIAASGSLCLKWGIHLPYRTEIAFLALPLYHLGYYFKKYHFFKLFLNLKWKIWLIILVLLITHLIVYSLNIKVSGIRYVNMIANTTGQIYLFYLGAVLAIVYVLLMSLKIKKISIINFLGQNSLVIMAIHVLIIHFSYRSLQQLFGLFGAFSILFSLSVTLITLMICIPIIFLFKKFLPAFTGYKSFIHINSGKSTDYSG